MFLYALLVLLLLFTGIVKLGMKLRGFFGRLAAYR
jgi:hypothetical protein